MLDPDLLVDRFDLVVVAQTRMPPLMVVDVVGEGHSTVHEDQRDAFLIPVWLTSNSVPGYCAVSLCISNHFRDCEVRALIRASEKLASFGGGDGAQPSVDSGCLSYGSGNYGICKRQR